MCWCHCLRPQGWPPVGSGHVLSLSPPRGFWTSPGCRDSAQRQPAGRGWRACSQPRPRREEGCSDMLAAPSWPLPRWCPQTRPGPARCLRLWFFLQQLCSPRLGQCPTPPPPPAPLQEPYLCPAAVLAQAACSGECRPATRSGFRQGCSHLAPVTTSITLSTRKSSLRGCGQGGSGSAGGELTDHCYALFSPSALSELSRGNYGLMPQLPSWWCPSPPPCHMAAATFTTPATITSQSYSIFHPPFHLVG